jgi:hypothetical protein
MPGIERAAGEAELFVLVQHGAAMPYDVLIQDAIEQVAAHAHTTP